MMTLNEAVLRCQERAKADCSECETEHQKLSEWLKELKMRREKQIPIEMPGRKGIKRRKQKLYYALQNFYKTITIKQKGEQ